MTTDTDMDGAWPLPTGRIELLGPEPEEARPVAPWPDFLGQPIRHGDTLTHPDGQEFVAVRLPGYADPGDAWRAIYPGVPQDSVSASISRLCLQIGDKGRAVLTAPPARPVAPAGWPPDAVHKAAAAVLDRWENSAWKWDDDETPALMADLRAAIDASPAAPAPVALSQRAVDDLINASREADEGPTELVRRVERAHGIKE